MLINNNNKGQSMSTEKISSQNKQEQLAILHVNTHSLEKSCMWTRIQKKKSIIAKLLPSFHKKQITLINNIHKYKS